MATLIRAGLARIAHKMATVSVACVLPAAAVAESAAANVVASEGAIDPTLLLLGLLAFIAAGLRRGGGRD